MGNPVPLIQRRVCRSGGMEAELDDGGLRFDNWIVGVNRRWGGRMSSLEILRFHDSFNDERMTNRKAAYRQRVKGLIEPPPLPPPHPNPNNP